MTHITTSLSVRQSLIAVSAALALLALGMAATVQASPVTIYSNLGPDASYDCCSSYAAEYSPAMAFTVPAGADYELTQIDIGLTAEGDLGTASVTVSLMTDAGGIPGSVITSWTLTNLPEFGSITTIDSSQTIPGIAGITLSGGTQYWLTVFPDNPDTHAGWNFNSTSQKGGAAYSYDGGNSWIYRSSDILGAFEVHGDPVALCQPLSITDLGASPAILWPPNHKMVPVTVSGTTTGGCGEVSCRIDSVTSNESLNANGDWQITGPLTLNMRAERLGNGSGRIYTIAVQCTDSESNSDQSATLVVVPHDQRK